MDHLLSVVILAAGKGTRMKSDMAKVLHDVFFAPMVHHVITSVTTLSPARTILVVGHQKEAVIESLDHFDVHFAEQKEQLGTGHAVAISQDLVADTSDTVMILCGDTPLIRPEMLSEMYSHHRETGADLTLLTTILDNPTNYGRILTRGDGAISAIVEEKDATPEQRNIREINAGIYCVNREFLFNALADVTSDNSQGEIYLTDIVGIAVKRGKNVERFVTPHAIDVLGVNSRVELAQAHSELQIRHNREVMLSGVTMQSPETIVVSPESSIGQDCLIMAGAQILGNSLVGPHTHVGVGVIIHNSIIGNHVDIGPYSVLHNTTVADGSSTAPHHTQSGR